MALRLKWWRLYLKPSARLPTNDVLIADLNVSPPGDGFTVVSAMRCTQPNCVNFILTGFPAFETALEAIRRHVDDYLLNVSRSRA